MASKLLSVLWMRGDVRVTATEELRHILDERGVEWKEVGRPERDPFTEWTTCNGAFRYWSRERDGKLLVETATSIKCSASCTPEQAIEATLGPGTCHADETDTIGALYNDNHHIKKITIHVMECSECGHTYEHVNGGYEYCPRCGRKVVGDG